ncbi:MAG: hypothetical protein KUG75_00155 [Pseudomonadales bacterium]|nr:hypothetical protein [Pseudomonadales bacterium]
MLGFSFRFRGKTKRLLALYHCFLEHPGVGLHPIQLAKYTGLSFAEVASRLNTTQELFVRLPKRKDGITRYRLTSSISAQSSETVEKLIHVAAKKETTTLYTLSLMIFCVFVMGIIMVFPYDSIAP